MSVDESAEQDVVAEAEAIARAAHDAIARNDLQALRELLDESVVWHATGDDGYAGTYRGREAVIAALAARRSLGTIDLVSITAEREPEVAGFAFGSYGSNSAFVTTTQESSCADAAPQTRGVIVVQQAKIMEFGTMGLGLR